MCTQLRNIFALNIEFPVYLLLLNCHS